MAYEMMSSHQSTRLQVDYDKIITSASIDEPFMTFSKRYEALCVSMVDVVNSTYITASLPLEKTTQYYSIFLNSMAKIAKIFGARVVKNIGDSLLFYFPTFVSLDEILECNTSMLEIRSSLCKKLKQYGLPEIDYRISSDYGPTLIATCEKTTQEDIFGNSVNMCSKINRLAEKNSFVVGGDLYSIARTVPGYSFSHTKNYHSGFKVSYPVYHVWSK
jgi:class 3 adenylate cyclase